MKTLELKHLAPYMPYRLKFIIDMYEFTDGNCKPEIRHFTMGNDLSMCLNYGKPILRPLSDLTKEIEVDSELTTISIDNTWGRFEEISTLKPPQLRFYQLREYELLLEYHFDVFGLIEQGLAIDINTLIK